MTGRAAGALRSHNSRNLAGRPVFSLSGRYSQTRREHNTSFRRLSRPDVARAHLSVDFREFIRTGKGGGGGLIGRRAGQREEDCLFTDGEMLSDYRVHAAHAIATATNHVLSVCACTCVCVCGRAHEFVRMRPCTVTGLQSHTVAVARLHTAPTKRGR